MNHWMFNCREVSEKVSRSMDEPLPLSQRLGIRLHLFMCRLCARNRRQLFLLRRILRAHIASDPAYRLSEEAKHNMVTKIRSAGAKKG
jgi:hypothetical protein